MSFLFGAFSSSLSQLDLGYSAHPTVLKFVSPATLSIGNQYTLGQSIFEIRNINPSNLNIFQFDPPAPEVLLEK